MSVIGVFNGPNLNMLGLRQPSVYGTETLESISKRCSLAASAFGADVLFLQTNSEHELVEQIQNISTNDECVGCVFNLAAFTHTSIACRDAILTLLSLNPSVVTVEVHISNVYKRDEFRRKSFISDIVDGLICGLGPIGYELAIRYIQDRTATKDK